MQCFVLLLLVVHAAPVSVLHTSALQEIMAQLVEPTGFLDVAELTREIQKAAQTPITPSGAAPEHAAQCSNTSGLRVLAVIPARSGSKSVPHKNIRQIGGAPMIVHSIRHAQQSKHVNRVMVTTDSEQYRQVVRDAGAEAPFLRPPEMAADLSPDLPAFEHALEWLKTHEEYIPDIIVHLRPTCPVRLVADIDKAIEILMNSSEIDAVRSVSPAVENPYRMWTRNTDGMMSPIAIPPANEGFGAYRTGDAGNSPRQLTPDVWAQNCCIEVVRTSMITQQKSMTGSRIFGLVTVKQHDIDTEADFSAAKEDLHKTTPWNESLAF